MIVQDKIRKIITVNRYEFQITQEKINNMGARILETD
jgi:hypothetical protein